MGKMIMIPPRFNTNFQNPKTLKDSNFEVGKLRAALCTIAQIHIFNGVNAQFGRKGIGMWDVDVDAGPVVYHVVDSAMQTGRILSISNLEIK